MALHQSEYMLRWNSVVMGIEGVQSGHLDQFIIGVSLDNAAAHRAHYF